MPEQTASFARNVKEEVARLEWEDERKRPFLSAYFRINGALHIGNGHESLLLSTESAQIAKVLYSFVTSLYGVPARFAYTKGMHFRKRVQYHVLLDEPDYLLGDLEVDYFSGKIPQNVVKGDSLASAYLTGAFLAGGSVNDPHSTNYHLEIAVNDEQYARWLMHLFNKVQNNHFDAKMTKRRKQWIVYLKKSEQIADFLILMGANDSCLHFENVRVDRDFANNSNRLNNLDTANFAKTMKASERQKKEVAYFVEEVGLENIMNPKMRLLMELRLSHEDASLEELANLMSEELASTVSKSNVNHLFRAIHQKYEETHGTK